MVPWYDHYDSSFWGKETCFPTRKLRKEPNICCTPGQRCSIVAHMSQWSVMTSPARVQCLRWRKTEQAASNPCEWQHNTHTHTETQRMNWRSWPISVSCKHLTPSMAMTLPLGSEAGRWSVVTAPAQACSLPSLTQNRTGWFQPTQARVQHAHTRTHTRTRKPKERTGAVA